MDQDSMTHGVVTSNVDTIIEEIRLDLCDNAITALRNNEALKNLIKEGWSGADCEAFLANFDAAVEKTCTALENYEAEIRNTLNSIPTQWSEFQGTNVKPV